MTVTFRCQIKEINHKALVSGDMSSRITLEADNLLTDIKNNLNSTQDAVENKSGEVNVTIEV